MRPTRELKGFAKVFLKGRNTEIATIVLKKSDFEYFNSETECYELQETEFKLEIGSSSRDIRLSKVIYLK